MILGIESTAHTFGIGIVNQGKIIANIKDSYTTEKGGIIPTDAAKHHSQICEKIYEQTLEKVNITEDKIKAIAFSQGPGLAPCLLEGIKFAKELSKKLNKPLVPVNHCIAHLEIGKTTGAKDPVMLYVSGANTQIIAYASGKYRVFGETLDLGTGNFIDTFARYAGLGFPGGPKIAELAEKGKKYIGLPYSVKGMDVALSGILTKLRQMLEKMNSKSATSSTTTPNLCSQSSQDNKLLIENSNTDDINNKLCDNKLMRRNLTKSISEQSISKQNKMNYTLEDLSFSLQETVFAMLVEASERALAHTGKKELLLGGGVACNKRLQEMCKIMCRERGCKFFCPANEFLVDNGTMIAYLGEIMFKKKIFEKYPDKLDIKPRQRTDEVEVRWK